MHAIPSQSSLPATKALEQLQGNLPAREYRRTVIVSPDSSGSSLSSMGEIGCKRSFDMDELIRATEPVEESIAFPVIEWCRDDSDEDETDVPPTFNKSLTSFVRDEEDEDDTSLGKRRRTSPHMVRCKSLKTRLCSLATSSNSFEPATSALESMMQSGSWGHFVHDDDTPSFSIGSNNRDSPRSKSHRKRSSKSPMSRCHRREHLQLLAQDQRPTQLEHIRRIVL